MRPPLSPDGREAAVAGFSGRDGYGGFHIYVFDPVTGRLKRQIADLPNVIFHLAYSRDGAYLAAALGGKNGIRVYDTATLGEIARDSDYDDSSYWLDFDAEGRLVTSCRDGFIRLYDAGFKQVAEQRAPGGDDPFAVAFSPNGKKVAVGYYDSTAVNVLDGGDLHFLYAADTSGIDNGDLSSVAWSVDGQTLYAGGQYSEISGSNLLLAWPQAGRGARQNWPVSDNTIMDFKPLMHQRMVYGAGDPNWGVVDSSGQKLLEKTALIVDHRASRPNRLRLNTDASVIAFELGKFRASKTIIFDLNRQSYESGIDNDLQSSKTTADSIALSDWYDTYKPKLNQHPLELDPYEISRGLAVSRDEQHFLLGTDWYVRYYDRRGQLQWLSPAPRVTWAVNLSADNRFAIAAFGDGTIRWYSLSDGAEQLAFFPHADGKRWVLWMPEGFYAASENAEELIGYHLNQGEDKEGLFVKVKQLSKYFYRPDLIAQRLNGDESGIRQALAEIGDVRKVLAAGLPPQIELLSDAESTQSESDYTLRIKLNDQGGGIGRVVYKVNGSVIEGRPVDFGIPGYDPLNRRFDLADGDNVIEVSAFNARNQIESRTIQVKVHVDRPEQKVDLYVLSLGISHYRDKALELKFADRDAAEMAEELEKRGQGLFSAVHVYPPLLNEQATLANLQAAFSKLATQMQPQDVFVLYLAGHGKAVDGSFYFVPWDLIIQNADSLAEQGLTQQDLQDLLAKIPTSKSVILLDTCDAGAFALAREDLSMNALASRGIEQKTALSRLMRATGRAMLAATSDDHMALEGYQKHGVFTYALLEALKLASRDDNVVDINELVAYVEKRVPEITKNQWGYEQFPMHDLQGMSFAIGLKP